ncbi:DUF4234 domain-containing protein [Providencia manganoxydans]|uniref:DUF4234 domain-containing protein n=1 Tax=Providencia manganoxydans TaxID=2923283 RepID=UPI0034E3F70B
MSDINYLSKKLNTTTLQFVLFTILTAGIYPVIWLYKTSQLIETETQQVVIHPYYYIIASMLLGWEMVLGDARLVMSMGSDFYGFSMILSKVYFIVLIVWAFKAKSILQMYYLKMHGVDIKPNAFYTLIFSVYYINFLINSISEIKEKSDLVQKAYLQNEKKVNHENEK